MLSAFVFRKYLDIFVERVIVRFITAVSALCIFNVGVGALFKQEFDGFYWQLVVYGLVKWSQFSDSTEVDICTSHQELFHSLQVGWFPLEIDGEDIVARFFIF